MLFFHVLFSFMEVTAANDKGICYGGDCFNFGGECFNFGGECFNCGVSLSYYIGGVCCN